MIIYYTKEGKFEVNKMINIPWKKLHRKNKPAYIDFDDNNNIIFSQWYLNGKRHREHGPAIVINSKNRQEQWWIDGKKHRVSGPAIIWNNGDEEYWINGQQLNIKKVNDWIKNNNIDLKTKQHQVLFMLKFG